jgi:hypothetical protein
MNTSLHFTLKGQTMRVTFIQDKTTKNTVRFVTGNPGDEISGSIYVRKDSELAKEKEISVEIGDLVVEAA